MSCLVRKNGNSWVILQLSPFYRLSCESYIYSEMTVKGLSFSPLMGLGCYKGALSLFWEISLRQTPIGNHR